MDLRKIVAGVIVVIILGLGSLQLLSEQSGAGKIVAFCGSASKPALQDAAENFEEETGITVELHFSGSGTMLSEMKMSEAGDLYIPGSPDYMVRAMEDNVVYPETIEKVAYLVPAIITPKGNPENIDALEDLASDGTKVGIGNPKSVCVGEYAVGVLENNGLYDEVEKNITVHAKSCSDTASLAAAGTVDAIIGWRVFHFWHPDETEIVYIENDRVPRIAFVPAAVSKFTNNRAQAQKFIDYLTSSQGNHFFQEYDYIPTENEARDYAPGATILEVGG